MLQLLLGSDKATININFGCVSRGCTDSAEVINIRVESVLGVPSLIAAWFCFVMLFEISRIHLSPAMGQRARKTLLLRGSNQENFKFKTSLKAIGKLSGYTHHCCYCYSKQVVSTIILGYHTQTPTQKSTHTHKRIHTRTRTHRMNHMKDKWN